MEKNFPINGFFYLPIFLYFKEFISHKLNEKVIHLILMSKHLIEIFL